MNNRCIQLIPTDGGDDDESVYYLQYPPEREEQQRVAAAAVERQLASWIGAGGSLLLPSGYQANLTLMVAIAGPGDVVVSDEDNHASLIDGLRLSRARVKIYRHGDAEHAAALLEQSRGARRVFCVTESIFSMGGDLAPLAALSEACLQHGAGLIVDEAHALGVVGPAGRGGFAASGAAPEPLVAPSGISSSSDSIRLTLPLSSMSSTRT